VLKWRLCVKFFLPQVVEENSPQPMDVADAGLRYDLNGWSLLDQIE